MKKILIIIVFSLFFAKDSYARSWECILDYKDCSFFEKIEMKAKGLNPLNYFEKRKKCKEGADRADTVHMGKIYYKNCMDN